MIDLQTLHNSWLTGFKLFYAFVYKSTAGNGSDSLCASYLCASMNRNKLNFAGFLLMLLTVAACTQPVSKTRVPVKEEEERAYDPHFGELPKDYSRQYFDSIRSYFYRQFEPKGFSGMLLVAKNGHIIFEHYQGVANSEQHTEMSSKTPVHVASISKVVTAVAVLRLVDEGKIRLDDDIRNYLPIIPYEGITVRMLMNHRSGIPYYGYFPTAILPKDRDLTNNDLLHLLHDNKLPLYFPSGTKFAYCNTNYALLALIVEKVTKKPFPEAMKELVFKPLEMEHSFIFEKEKAGKDVAQSYNSKGQLQEHTNLDAVYGDKNLYTTARDLLKFDRGTYSDAFLSKKMKAEMFKGYSYEKPGKSNYGLGIRMREEQGKLPYFFHTGWWHGNTGCYVSMRQDTVCMVILSNRYTRRVFSINKLSLLFGNYPFGSSVDPREAKEAEAVEEK